MRLAISLYAKPGVSLRMRGDTQVPSRAFLNPVKHRIGHEPEMPALDVAVQQVIRDSIRENMFDRERIHYESTQEPLYAAACIREGDGRTCLCFRVPPEK